MKFFFSSIKRSKKTQATHARFPNTTKHFSKGPRKNWSICSVENPQCESRFNEAWTKASKDKIAFPGSTVSIQIVRKKKTLYISLVIHKRQRGRERKEKKINFNDSFCLYDFQCIALLNEDPTIEYKPSAIIFNKSQRKSEKFSVFSWDWFSMPVLWGTLTFDIVINCYRIIPPKKRG